MGAAEILAGLMLGSLVIYAVLGGADFGAGVWDLLASGRRAREQRTLIDRAIAPVWEANHVWLILIVVILFTAFPAAFSAASVWLHIPLTFMLVGIVFRGSAFVFRKYDVTGDPFRRRWGRVFALSSVVTPFFLGVCLGAATSGRLAHRDDAHAGFVAQFVSPWLHVFHILVGLLALAIFAFLSAVYLTVEARTRDLQDDFRVRALVAAVCSAILAAATAFSVEAWWKWYLFVAATAAWAAAIWALRRRRYALARIAAIGLVSLIVAGWGFAQYPDLISPNVTIHNAAAPERTLRIVLVVAAVGAVIIFPSIYWLLRIFKHDDARGR
jgi:cytochrome d ubiquinol oxidase subunit II